MATSPNYVFALNAGENAVDITNDLGYQSSIQGLPRITSQIPEEPTVQGDQPWITIYTSDTTNPFLRVRIDMIDEIGGNAAAGSLAGVIAQLQELFAEANKGAGGGGGSANITNLVFKMGTPPNSYTGDLSPIVVSNGATITNAALEGDADTSLIVVVGAAWQSPLSDGGYTYDYTTGQITFFPDDTAKDSFIFITKIN